MVLSFASQHGRVARADVVELCHLTTDQAAKLLKKLKDRGLLQQQGERRWASYTLAEGAGS